MQSYDEQEPKREEFSIESRCDIWPMPLHGIGVDLRYHDEGNENEEEGT